jgi:uncharacterized protein YaaN involved in tellurite resistance
MAESSNMAAVQAALPNRSEQQQRDAKTRDLTEKARASASHLSKNQISITESIIDAGDHADSKQLEMVYEMHEKYADFGADELKDLIPTIGKDGNGHDISMRELDAGNESSKDIAKTLNRLSASLSDMDKTNAFNSTISNIPVLNKIRNPVRAFFNRSRKAGSVIEDCVKKLTQYEIALCSDISKYKNDRLRATKCSEVAAEQAAIADSIINQLTEELSSDRFDNSPELKEAIQSEVLNTLERRKIDLLSIATNQSAYVSSIDLLAKSHYRMLELVKSTKNTAVIKFNSAVEVAQGVYVQEIARKAVRASNKASADLDMTNAVNLKDSVENINKETMNLEGHINDMSAAVNTIIEAQEAYRDAEKRNAANMHEAALRSQRQLNLMNKRIKESQTLDDTRREMMDRISEQAVKKTIKDDHHDDE